MPIKILSTLRETVKWRQRYHLHWSVNIFFILKSKNMKSKILFLMLTALSISVLSFASVEPPKTKFKVQTVEQSIEIYYNSTAAYYHATNDAQRSAAIAMISGVTNPLNYNDPDLQDKVEAFLATKLDAGCVGAAAVCAMQFYSCRKQIPPPPPDFCYQQMSECMRTHCGGIPY